MDEAGAKTNRTRLRGRAPRGQRVHDHIPLCHWSTTTMLCSVRRDGTTAAMTIDGPTTSEVFRAYVEHILVPTLRPGDIVVLDNLSPHKDKAAVALIEAAGAQVRPLPPYSPDLNPIEVAFAKLKALLRAGAVRTIDALWRDIGQICDLFEPDECKNYFAAAGYGFR
jgi:transposase